MVQIEDFEFQLVCPETKIPFKEHYKNQQTYVEAEPDAEYYISVRKTRMSQTSLYCKYYVDGRDLGYYDGKQASKIDYETVHRGVWSQANGVSTQKALKFVKAMFSRNNSSSSSSSGPGPAAMGQVKLDVYEGEYQGNSYQSNFASSFDTKPSVLNRQGSVEDDNMAKKKNLRSGEGTATMSSKHPGVVSNYKKGPLLYSITLNYCAAVGLIAVGVLPKPPLWVHHRMLHPAEPGDINNRSKVSVKRTSDGKDVLDLVAAGDDSSDDDDDDDDEEAENIPQKKVKHETAATSTTSAS